MDQALQKDRPWSVKESRVLEILQAVRVVSVHSKYSGIFQQFSIYVSCKPKEEGTISLIANCGILGLQMDSNMDGMVDFDEFVAATLHVHQLEENNSAKWQSRSKAAFSKFDVDGDGTLLLMN